MNKRKCIYIKDLLFLIDNIDNFKEFDEDFASIIYYLYKKNSCDIIDDIFDGKKIIGFKKVKEFVSKYRTLLDRISANEPIINYISEYYVLQEDEIGRKYEYSLIREYYDYLLKNKDKLSKAKLLVIVLDGLGFKRIILDENNLFTGVKYTIHPSDFHCVCLDNYEVIPNYDGDSIRIEYQTKSSDYMFELYYNASKGVPSDIIHVNNLFFDVNKLPEIPFSVKKVYDKLLSLKEEKRDIIDIITFSTDLSIAIDSLHDQFDQSSDEITSSLERYCDSELLDVETSSELLTNLQNIKDYIDKLVTIRQAYDEKVMEKTSLTQKDLFDIEIKQRKK